MPKAAIYGRFSDDKQKDTSIEDQVRRAKEAASRLGYEVPEELIFVDFAITGQEKGLSKRGGYAALCNAWDKRAFDAVFVDELPRLARDTLELAKLQVRLEKTHIRLVSTDGFDTNTPGWQLQFGMVSVIATHFIRETRHRVLRGMIGQLERGYMIACPPFGYSSIKEEDKGTSWVINEDEAKWVKEVYKMRRQCQALGAIARHLNENRVLPPRAPRKNQTSYWRPATVRQLLANTIYRGVFIWNGSAFTRAKAKREGTKVDTKEFQRPTLRLIDDETWFLCNRASAERPARGGDKQLLAGLVECSKCGAKLSVSHGRGMPALYCAQCAQARRAGATDEKSFYVSGEGVKQALLCALNHVFSPDCAEAFRTRLRNKLNSGLDDEINELRVRIARLERAKERLAKLLKEIDGDDQTLDEQFISAREEQKRLEGQLAILEAGQSQLDKTAIEKQLEVNPRDLLPKLFAESLDPARGRASLRRIFKSIVLAGRPARYCSDFLIGLAPGVALAELSRTPIADDEELKLKIRVRASFTRPTTWEVRLQEVSKEL